MATPIGNNLIVSQRKGVRFIFQGSFFKKVYEAWSERLGTESGKAKPSSFFDALFSKIFSDPDAEAWGIGGLVIGAIVGGCLGWTLLPPETLNAFQAITALIGIAVGGVIGFFVGGIGWYFFFHGILITIAVAAIYFLGTWLLSN